MSITFDDSAFSAALERELREEFPKIADDDAHDRAEAIADSARQHAEAHVLTGQTLDSIGVTKVEGGYEVGCDPDKVDNDKVLSEEFGSFDQAPRPFMRPAIEENVR